MSAQIYQVVPYTMLVQRWTARVGQRVFVSLWAALEDLERMIKDQERYDSELSREMGGRGTSSRAHNKKTVIVATHAIIPFKLVQQLDPKEPMLAEDVRGWKRLTLEEYNVQRVNQVLSSSVRLPRWQFEDRWLPLLPHSESPPKPAMMGKPFKRR